MATTHSHFQRSFRRDDLRTIGLLAAAGNNVRKLQARRAPGIEISRLKQRSAFLLTTTFTGYCATVVLGLVIAVFSPMALHAAIIQESNSIPYSLTGWQGGIPSNFTVYTNIPAGTAVSAINDALDNCPTNQLVVLDAGRFPIGGHIDISRLNGKGLRGAGPGLTIISNTAGGRAITTTDYTIPRFGTDDTALSAGYTKGSSNVTVANATGFRVGAIIGFKQNDDTNWIRATTGPESYLRFCSVVTAIAGTSISFWPSLPYALSASHSPVAVAQQDAGGDYTLSRFIIENLTIDNNPANANPVIEIYSAHEVGIKNVEITRLAVGIQFYYSVGCTVQGCYLRDADSFPTQPDGYGVYLHSSSTWNRIEDCMFYRLGQAFIQSYAGGNAIINSWAHEMTGSDSNWQFPNWNDNHGAGGMMTLFEGVVGEQYQNDAYHGSTTHGTLFRSYIHGTNGSGRTLNRKMVDLNRGSWRYNIVGNVLGHPSWSTNSDTVYTLTGQPGAGLSKCIYRFGYPNTGNNGHTETAENTWQDDYIISYPDQAVTNTITLHGNYDYKTRSQIWDENIADHDIPNSLIYNSKPDYFGFLAWPPFNPASPDAAQGTNIPAGWRFAQIAITGEPYAWTNAVPAESGVSSGSATTLMGFRGLRLRK